MTKTIHMMLVVGIAMSMGTCHSPVRLGMAGDESPKKNDSESESSAQKNNANWQESEEALQAHHVASLITMFAKSATLVKSAAWVAGVNQECAEDLSTVLAKIAAGEGVKKNSIKFMYACDDVNSIDKDVFSKEGWHRFPINKLEAAHLKIPSQNSDSDWTWSCGPNSAARALCLWGHNFDTESYNRFKAKCPKICGRPNTSGNQKLLEFWGAFTLGIAPMIVSNLPDVGPTPSQLAAYITRCLPEGQYAYSKTYDSFEECAQAIKDAIGRRDPAPVIAFLVLAWHHMQYTPVVGVRLDSSNEIISFALLDTTKALQEVSYEEMRYQMDTSGSVMRGPYNLVRFYRPSA